MSKVLSISTTSLKKILTVLACPDCKGDVVLKGNSLQCKKCKEMFEVREGIPVLLPKRN